MFRTIKFFFFAKNGKECIWEMRVLWIGRHVSNFTVWIFKTLPEVKLQIRHWG